VKSLAALLVSNRRRSCCLLRPILSKNLQVAPTIGGPGYDEAGSKQDEKEGSGKARVSEIDDVGCLSSTWVLSTKPSVSVTKGMYMLGHLAACPQRCRIFHTHTHTHTHSLSHTHTTQNSVVLSQPSSSSTAGIGTGMNSRGPIQALLMTRMRGTRKGGRRSFISSSTGYFTTTPSEIHFLGGDFSREMGREGMCVRRGRRGERERAFMDECDVRVRIIGGRQMRVVLMILGGRVSALWQW
jgi:hypothetical protein